MYTYLNVLSKQNVETRDTTIKGVGGVAPFKKPRTARARPTLASQDGIMAVGMPFRFRRVARMIPIEVILEANCQ